MTTTADESWVGVQSVAYAGLDALLSVHSLDLCGYLHVGADLGPQLYLRRPTLGDMDPAEAFRLFSSLRDLLEAGEGPIEIDGYEALALASVTPTSRGLWVAGRRDEPPDERTIATVGQLGRAVMHLCAEAERVAAHDDAPSIGRVAIETTDTDVHAEVSVIRNGGERVGAGEATTALAAVAWATLAATDPTLKLLAAEEDTMSDSRVALVLVRDVPGRTTVGAALVNGDPLRAAAAATLAAIASFA